MPSQPWWLNLHKLTKVWNGISFQQTKFWSPLFWHQHDLETSTWRDTNLHFEDVPLVEFMYLVFTCMPGESYCTGLKSLLLYLCYIFQVLTPSLVCWFWDFNLKERGREGGREGGLCDLSVCGVCVCVVYVWFMCMHVCTVLLVKSAGLVL